MKILILILTRPAALLILSACALPPIGTGPVAARPVEARLASGAGADRLAVVFSDGVICHAQVPRSGGQGQFADCAHPARYAVVVRARNILEPIFEAAVSPYATVTVTDTDDRVKAFALPEPVRMN